MQLLYIPDLILKLYVFIPFLIQVIFLSYDGQNGTWSSKSKVKDNKFEYYFPAQAKILTLSFRLHVSFRHSFHICENCGFFHNQPIDMQNPILLKAQEKDLKNYFEMIAMSRSTRCFYPQYFFSALLLPRETTYLFCPSF